MAIGLNRQERGQGELSAIQELEQAYDIPVLSIIDMGHLIEYLEAREHEAVPAMHAYRERYGV